MNISRCKNFVYILLALSTIIFITIRTVSSQEGCGECPNPIVKLKDLEVGDVSDVKDELLEMAKTFIGWEELLEKSDVTIFEMINRAWGFLFDLKKKNPCADIYYEYQKSMGEGEYETRRVGVKSGEAKYVIQSKVDIDKAGLDEKVLVRNIVYNKPTRKVSKWGIVYYEYDEDVIELSEQLKLIPKKGSIKLHNELISLKNNEIYDMGDSQLDWIPDPPMNESYFATDETLTVNGKLYKGSESIIVGSFTVGHITGIPIKFNHGDIGITIRKKETPSSCSIDVDDTSEFPPYYKIRVTNIKNQFNETMPNNVLIALKAQKGKIVNGDELNGWRIFNTQKGRVVEPVLYEPPSCAEAETDTLEIAGVCDFHDGPPSIGKTRIKKEIPNSQCYDAVARITGKQVVIEEGEFNYPGPGGSKTLKKKYRKEIEATIHLMLTQTDTLPMIMQNEYLEYYKVESAHLTNFKADLRDWGYDYEKKTNSWSEVTETWVGHSSGEKVWEPPGYLPEVFSEGIVVVFDVETKKAKVVNIFFKNRIEYKFSKTLTQEGRGSGGSWQYSEKEEDIEHYYIGLVHEQIASPDCLVTSGDGINFMAGSGKATIDCSNEGDYATCTTEKTFSWEFRRMKKKRR